MARRKKNDGGAWVFVLGIVIVAYVVFTPILLLGAWIINLVRYRTAKENIEGKLTDFWLDADEQSEFGTICSQLKRAVNAIRGAEARGERENLSRNQDGQFSLRSNLGKEIRGVIDKNQAIVDDLSEDYDYYKWLPYNRWNSFKKSFIMCKAAQQGFLFWIIAVCFEAARNPEGFGVGFLRFLKFPMLMFNSQLQEGEFKKVMIVTTLALVVAGIQAAISWKKPQRMSPEPPEVTPENYKLNDDFAASSNDLGRGASQNEVASIERATSTISDRLTYGERRTLVNNLVCIMNADGEISDSERKFLMEVCADNDIDREELSRILNDSEEYEFVVPSDKRTRIYHLLCAVLMMVTDGDIDAEEVKYCKEIAARFGFNQSQIINDLLETVAMLDRNELTDEQFEEKLQAIAN